MDVATHPHIVIAGVEPWGHARPLCAFATKVVQTRDVHVTLFTLPRILDRVKNEVARGFTAESLNRQNLIRIVALDNCAENLPSSASVAERLKAESRVFTGSFMSAYQLLLSGGSLTCFATKTEFCEVSSPTMLVVDLLNGHLAVLASQLAHNTATIYRFCSSMASSVLVSLSTCDFGGRSDCKERTHEIAQRTGQSIEEAAAELSQTFTDNIIKLPGLPALHHYELNPQDIRVRVCLALLVSCLTGPIQKSMMKGFMGMIWYTLTDSYAACDGGLIVTSPDVYEPAAIAALKASFAETKRNVWTLGPLTLSGGTHEAVNGEMAQADQAIEIKRFMDDVLHKYGEQSLVYISFGSMFWVPDFTKLDEFLIAGQILNHGSPFAQLPDMFKTKVVQSGLGLLSKWTPQQTVLIHPALGWFVTHCGHNSVLEAVSSGVPMICWPFTADQPLNALLLTNVHSVAYELVEVRTGPDGEKPLHRTGKAPIGTPEALRAEVHDEMIMIAKGWDVGGNARVEMDKMLDGMRVGSKL
ncbi:hypothetical protein EIP91_000417 [Steccherinum ochraceum]|uniref:UDP-glycosyltransferases domain-containing protein n=1 Tax=Steccherinum ochraceum TaxID=92696 RepID=A0A4R0RFS8_9APHY|nr:hypothetical protein EIP91_000417 [Steccherinum ochraceum]